MPETLAGGNGFHAKGSVSLLGAASFKSDGATYDSLFFGGYLWVIGLPWLDCVMLMLTVGWGVVHTFG